MLEQLIPNFTDEKIKLSALAPSGWIMGFNLSFRGPDYIENTYPGEWSRIYEKRNYWFVDPVANWSAHGDGTTRWSDIKYTLDRQPMMEHARLYGLKFGACFATCDDSGRRCFLNISHSSREFTDQEIISTNRKFIAWVGYVMQSVSLTDGEKKVLCYLRSGMTQIEVAKRCNVSEATVKRRIRDCVLKMKCKTTAQAVAYATSRQLI